MENQPDMPLIKITVIKIKIKPFKLNNVFSCTCVK